MRQVSSRVISDFDKKSYESYLYICFKLNSSNYFIEDLEIYLTYFFITLNLRQ